ncbi:hypothetical protein [Burkholderia anthina]|uniref:hypothetical protein n=1 Tax=Burkholderia anthina TaxID=179879 RepID=UPI001589B085|nr:hypothetical protein [Burkholderia anthina]
MISVKTGIFHIGPSIGFLRRNINDNGDGRREPFRAVSFAELESGFFNIPQDAFNAGAQEAAIQK